MRGLFVSHTAPQSHHLALARKHGTESLDENAPVEFWIGAPCFDCMTRAEPGTLIKRSDNVEPHTDQWLGDFGGRSPRFQRSIFWLLHGDVIVKVDGFKAKSLAPGDWVIFDHRREHLVMASDTWLGAAWQVGRCGAVRGIGADIARVYDAEKHAITNG